MGIFNQARSVECPKRAPSLAPAAADAGAPPSRAPSAPSSTPPTLWTAYHRGRLPDAHLASAFRRTANEWLDLEHYSRWLRGDRPFDETPWIEDTVGEMLELLGDSIWEVGLAARQATGPPLPTAHAVARAVVADAKLRFDHARGLCPAGVKWATSAEEYDKYGSHFDQVEFLGDKLALRTPSCHRTAEFEEVDPSSFVDHEDYEEVDYDQGTLVGEA